jgi:phage minor structural protein
MPTQYLQSYDRYRKRIGILKDAYDITRSSRINADYSLSFTVPMSSADYRDKLPLKGHVMDEKGQFYVINKREKRREDRKLIAQITCNHVMFKLADYKFPYASYVSEAYGISITTLTSAIAAATGGRFTLSVEDTFDLVDVRDFGRGNCLEALNTVLALYGAEVEPDNFTLHLRGKIGSSASPQQFRLGKNIVAATLSDDGASLCTRLYAEMKDSRTWVGQPASILTADERARLEAIPGAIVNGKLAVNYLVSPYADLWASDSVPYYDALLTEQNLTDPLKLLDAARKRLSERDIPLFEISVSTADIHKLPYSVEKPPGLGDTATFLDDDLGLTGLTGRIMELTEYPYALDRHSQLTVANVMTRDYTQIIADLETSRRAIDNVFSGGRIRTDVFEAFAKQVIVDITNSKTELIYPAEGGLLAQDKAKPLRQVRLTSAGLGISTDGWQNVRSAITADGVIAERIVGQEINGVSLSIGSGNSITRINPNGISAGHSSYAEAPFRVDMAGNVVANKLTAKSATFNDSKFNDGEIVGSSINVGNGNFTVSSGGIMTARDGNFKGNISGSTISGGTIIGGIITGGTITGATLQTAEYGPRFEVDDSGWRTVDAKGNIRVSASLKSTIGQAGLEWRGPSGVLSGNISGEDRVLSITSDGLMVLSANNGSLYLSGTYGIDLKGIVTVEDFDKIKDVKGSMITALIATKATAGSSTGQQHEINGGIPKGTRLLVEGGGVVVWNGVPAHSHTQT